MSIDLRPLAHKDPESQLCVPFTVVDRLGKVWNCVSNRKYLLAIKGRGVYHRWQGDGADLGVLLKLLHCAPNNATKLKVAEILDWVNTHIAKECGVLLDVVLPLDQLKQLFEMAPLKFIEVWKPGKEVAGDDRSLAIQAGDSWKVVIMGCNQSTAGLPVFGDDDQTAQARSALDIVLSEDPE